MKIQLPPRKINGEQENPDLEFHHLVVIGANGSGKTRFGSWIEMNNPKGVHRISAQKSLKMPSSVHTSSMDEAMDNLLFGMHGTDREWQEKYGRIARRWNNNVNTSLLNDFDQLLVVLHTEEYEKSLDFTKHGGEKPITKLDKIQGIWEELIPNRKLNIKAGMIEVFPCEDESQKYNSSEMSDGERVIFYLIGESLCARENSIIIIDEPEMHLHASILKRLFDLIESARLDCSFIYLTHSIDFAFSRQNATKIWMKSYNDNVWNYEILGDTTPVPEQLYLEILGSRLPILLIEGDNSSLDYRIYSQIFPDYTVKPVGSCNNVIQYTKTLNRTDVLSGTKVFGLIDRDRRDHDQISGLLKDNIWVLDVAEVENLFLLEDVVKVMAGHMRKDSETVFREVKNNLIEFFSRQLEPQVLLHFKDAIRLEYQGIANFNAQNISEAITEINYHYNAVDKQDVYHKIKSSFQKALCNQDYDEILRVFNLKHALMPNARICEAIGLRTQEEYYNLMISFLKEDNENSDRLKKAIISKIIKMPSEYITDIPSQLTE